MQRSDSMGRASIGKLLLRFAGPSIVTMLALGSYNVVDAIFVGRIGPEALAALQVSFPLMMIFVAIGTGTGVGAASLISRYLGAGEHREANRAAAVAISVSILFGILVTAVCLPSLDALLRLFSATGPVLPLAKSYLSILIIFAFLNFFPMAAGSIVRAEGNPILPSVVGVISVLVNIALDPILIFGLGPAPAMGIAGAATATVVARGISTIVLLGYLVSKRTSYRFHPSYFIPRLRILFEIYRVGLSQTVQMASESVVIAFANRVAMSFGVLPLAITGVLLRSSSFVFMPCVGLAQGALPLVGYNFGANQKERVGMIISRAGSIAFGWSVAFFVLAMTFPTQLISIFGSEPEFLYQGTQAVRIFALGFSFIGIQIVLSSFFQGIGKGIPSLVLASARTIIFLLPALVILPKLYGLTGLWAAFPQASFLASVLTVVWAAIQFRKLGIRFRLRYRQLA